MSYETKTSTVLHPVARGYDTWASWFSPTADLKRAIDADGFFGKDAPYSHASRRNFKNLTCF